MENKKRNIGIMKVVVGIAACYVVQRYWSTGPYKTVLSIASFFWVFWGVFDIQGRSSKHQ